MALKLKKNICLDLAGIIKITKRYKQKTRKKII